MTVLDSQNGIILFTCDNVVKENLGKLTLHSHIER